MLSVGIDAIEIKRFNKFAKLSKKQLQKIFSEHEINYCLSNPQKTSERFAVRFAAKEAFLKAISPLLNSPISLFKIFKLVSVYSTGSSTPILKVHWKKLKIKSNLKTLLSLTHTKETGLAVVIIEK